MPLPAALQARLLKRGIVAGSEASKHDEEIIAENYDDSESHRTKNDDAYDSGVECDDVVNCPNVANLYHECTDYCRKRYGTKKYRPDSEIERRRKKMLLKYPLPEGWKEVPDAYYDRCYYWNIYSDEVSWLPPNHPRAKITYAAKRIRQLELSKAESRVSQQAAMESGSDDDDDDDDDEDDDDDDNDIDDDEEDEIAMPPPPKRIKIGGRALAADLDPMDPSAYSDIPRGSWASGLLDHSKATTGADDTASGPLFQMRPYPSPGDVLRANKSKQGK